MRILPVVSANLPVVVAFRIVIVRSIVHGILALTELYQPETSIAVIADVPTMMTYFASAVAGYAYDVQGFIDARFFMVGTVTWFILGLTVGFLVKGYRQRFIARSQLQ